MRMSLISQQSEGLLAGGYRSAGPMPGVLSLMIRLMSKLLQEMMGGQAGGMPGGFSSAAPCSCGRPSFGQPSSFGPSGHFGQQGNPYLSFLGAPAGGSAFPAPAPFGPAAGSTPFAGSSGGDFASRLPSNLQPLAPYFQSAGQKYNVDPKFLAAISMLETANGTSSAFRNKRNAMGVSNSSGPISFSHPAESIERMARVLASNSGPYQGATTIGQIGRIYAPPGAGNDVNGTNGYWATGVSKFYTQLGGNPATQVLQRV